MLCPVCGTLRYRKEWLPSQWGDREWDRHGARGCRACESAFLRVRRSEAASLLGALFEVSRESARHEGALSLFVDGAALCSERKALSHKGALRSLKGESRDFFEGGEWYWDAGNAYYARAMSVAFPNIVRGRNEETLGDIVEALLGKSFDLSRDPYVPFDPYKEAADDLSNLVRATKAASEALPCFDNLDASMWAATVRTLG